MLKGHRVGEKPENMPGIIDINYVRAAVDDVEGPESCGSD